MTKDEIISLYMNYRLENNKKPASVYELTKANNKEESEFYAHFGTLESVERAIFGIFFSNTKDLIEKDSNYNDYESKDKLLSFYFTFFELLKANRSYVVLSLKEHSNTLKNLEQLSELRQLFKIYIESIITQDHYSKQEKLQKIQAKTIPETAWIQMLFTLKFWLEDASPALEKTDLFIEKSVKLSFDLMQIKPLESLVDFGKFIFKEKINPKP